MEKPITPKPTASTWEHLEDFVREHVQQFIQALLEEEVTELLGRTKSARREAVDAAPGYRNGVRHEAQRWNGWKIPSPIQGGDESLGRSLRRMQAGGERAAPERYWCGAMQTAKRPGLAQR
jgi:hypothetical protein